MGIVAQLAASRPVPDGVRVRIDVGELLADRVVLAAGAWVNRFFTGALADGVAGVGEAPEALGAARALPVVVTQEQPAHFQLRAGAPAEADWPTFTHAPTADGSVTTPTPWKPTLIPSPGVAMP